MKAVGFDLRRTYAGQWEMVVTLDPSSVAEAMRFVDNARTRKQGTLFEVLCRVFRKKRSIPANAYFHVLCNKLAAVLGVDDDEMKTHLVLKYGTVGEHNGVPAMIVLPKDTDPADYYRYCKWIGSDEQTDTYICYKQTHTLDGSEFQRLINGTVEDCKEMGIETMTPQELQALYEKTPSNDIHRHPAGGQEKSVGA